MHDFEISIFCGQDHREKKHPHAGVLSFALTPRSGGLGMYGSRYVNARVSSVLYYVVAACGALHVLVLRYVLSSGYQMRALHEFTNVSGS